MSKSKRNTKSSATKPTEAWETNRRRETHRVLKEKRKVLEALRANITRDLDHATRMLDALQTWADGGAFPEVATRYARLQPIVMEGRAVPHGSAPYRAAQAALSKIWELPSGETYEGLNECLIENAIDDAMMAACGLTHLSDGKAA